MHAKHGLSIDTAAGGKHSVGLLRFCDGNSPNHNSARIYFSKTSSSILPYLYTACYLATCMHEMF